VRIALQTRGIGVGDTLGALRSGFRRAVDAGLLSAAPAGLEGAHQAYVSTGVEPTREQVEAWLAELNTVAGNPSWRLWVSRAVGVVLALVALGLAGWAVSAFRALPGPEDGLTGVWFSEPNYQGHPFVRLDPSLALRWDAGGPLPGVPAAFSAKWRGCVVVEGENMWLVSRGESPHTVAVAGQTLSGGGDDKPWSIGEEALPRGVHPIEIALDHRGAEGKMFVGWRFGRNGVSRTIPPKNLVPVGGNGRHDCPGEPREFSF